MTATPRILKVEQGSHEWHAARARHFCASEAPAMMGASPYQTRAALLRAKATGVEREHDEATAELFRRGHESEASARQFAEEKLGEELFPSVMVREVEGLPLLASLDGITIDGAIIWEHKAYNEDGVRTIKQTGEPPLHHVWQLEHQLLVTGAERALFSYSDGTQDRRVDCWYASKQDRRAALIAGWKQFAADLEAARQSAPEPEPVKVEGRPVQGFGMLVLRVEGRVLASNLDAFRASAGEFLARLPRADELRDDQDFADAEQAVKACGEAEDRIRAAKEQAIAQMADVDAVLRAADEVAASIRAARLSLDKQVKARKESIRLELVQAAAQRVREHYATISGELGEYAPQPAATLVSDLGAAIKGLKTVASIRDRLHDAVAQHKLDANALARGIRANVALLREAEREHGPLWPDGPRLCRELSEEGMRGVIAARVEEWRKREQARIDAELARQAAQAAATQQQEKPAPAAEQKEKPAQARMLRISEINALIAPMRIDAEGLASLGVSVMARGASKMWSAHEVRAAFQRYVVVLSRSLDTL